MTAAFTDGVLAQLGEAGQLLVHFTLSHCSLLGQAAGQTEVSGTDAVWFSAALLFTARRPAVQRVSSDWMETSVAPDLTPSRIRVARSSAVDISLNPNLGFLSHLWLLSS